MTDTTYNGWSNRDTWAMKLNLDNEYGTYEHCEELARRAAVGNEDDPDAFHEELAGELEVYGRYLVAEFPSALPDFDPAGHESPDPKDPHGPDDVDGVDWQEIADTYDLSEYI